MFYKRRLFIDQLPWQLTTVRLQKSYEDSGNNQDCLAGFNRYDYLNIPYISNMILERWTSISAAVVINYCHISHFFSFVQQVKGCKTQSCDEIQQTKAVWFRSKNRSGKQLCDCCCNAGGWRRDKCILVFFWCSCDPVGELVPRGAWLALLDLWEPSQWWQTVCLLCCWRPVSFWEHLRTNSLVSTRYLLRRMTWRLWCYYFFRSNPAVQKETEMMAVSADPHRLGLYSALSGNTKRSLAHTC